MDKKANEIKTFFSRCRCCLEYGYLKNMWKEYTHNGEPEVYGDMLTKCFALIWDETENSKEQDQICEPCVQRLRDASDFKSTVLNSQAKLSITGEGVVKEEYLAETLESDDDTSFIIYPTGEDDSEDSSDDPDDESDTSRDRSEMEFKDDVKSEMNDFEVEYLEDDEDSKALFSNTSTTGVNETSNTSRRKRQRRTKEEIEKEGGGGRKWPKKLPKHERRKTYKQYTEEDMRKSLEAVRSQKLTPTEAGKKYGVPKKTIRAKLRSDSQVSQEKEETFQFIQELKQVLTYTNATPFKSFTNRYYCFYCLDGQLFEDPEDLKNHTKTHVEDRTTKIEYGLRPLWMNEIVKLDIGNLLCIECCFPILTWKDMFQHLTERHDVSFTYGFKKIIPYFLKSEVECALCSEKFANIMLLDSHMNAHYNNYICGDCGDTFLSRYRLKQHSKIHDTGKFACSQCTKVFTLDKYRKRHEEVVHNRLYVSKCHYCAEKVLGVKARDEHVIKAHPERVKHLTCKICNKVFTRSRDFLRHFSVHKNNNFNCKQCENQYSTRHELRQHVKENHKERILYECSTCSKRYLTPSSFRAHTRTHLNST